MARLDGDPMLELTIKEDGKTKVVTFGPYPRYLIEQMLDNAKQQPWFVEGKIVEPKAAKDD